MILKRTSNDTLTVTEVKGNFTGRTGVVKAGTEFKLQKLPETLNPTESLNKENQWKSDIILYDSKPDVLFQYTFYFENNYCNIHTDTWVHEDTDYDIEDYVIRNNKKYYHAGGGGRPYNYELTDDRIYIKDTDDNSSVLLAELTLLRNGNLKVVTTNTDSHYGLEKDLIFVCE